MTVMTDQANVDTDSLDAPDREISVRDTFGLDSDMMVPAFSQRTSHVPEIDPSYQFDTPLPPPSRSARGAPNPLSASIGEIAPAALRR